eukprot:TRINITY_DN35605_c0_g1_i1.p1 TRINITY_DN35605_c0_g1~~TRINITY_DN35605_c0_g1_i1.p1  ORF type:complete len:182 (-),score=40.51 TRINITY_DN35605_c0_g1_i1:56-601(-)
MSGEPRPTFELTPPGENPMGVRDPVSAISMEDRAFLEEFGKKISRTVGAAALIGGFGSYAVARQLGWKRRGLTTFLGATVCPLVAWYSVIMQERERVAFLGQRLQAAMGDTNMEGAVGSAPSAASPDEAMARLFPPPPTASVGMTAPPRGLMGGGFPGMSQPVPGSGFGGLRPPGSGSSGF